MGKRGIEGRVHSCLAGAAVTQGRGTAWRHGPLSAGTLNPTLHPPTFSLPGSDSRTASSPRGTQVGDAGDLGLCILPDWSLHGGPGALSSQKPCWLQGLSFPSGMGEDSTPSSWWMRPQLGLALGPAAPPCVLPGAPAQAPPAAVGRAPCTVP